MADLPVGTDNGAQEIEIVDAAAQFKASVDLNRALSTRARDLTISSSIAATNQTITDETNGTTTIVFSISGTWSGTLNIQGSPDGSTYFTIKGLSLSLSQLVTSITANDQLLIPCGGYKTVRLIGAAWVSGTANILADAGIGSQVMAVYNGNATDFKVTASEGGTWTVQPGNTPNTSPWLISIHDGTNKAAVESSLALRTEQILSVKAIYSAAVNAITPPATPTDMVTIIGSATKTVRVLQIELFSTQTLAGTNTFFIVKRSAADTGGTSATPTIVPHDSGSAAATAVVRSYTANPAALGAVVGTVQLARITTPAPAGAGPEGYLFDFMKSGIDSGIVLRGVAETLALNFNGAALPGGLSITANVTFLEE